MKIAIMQPYFFPYLGYFQMLNAVDKFVLLDDVNFIMRGYINRNSILINGKAHLFSIPLEKPSQNKLIKDTKIKFVQKDRENFLKTITLAYKKAPFYDDFFSIFKDIIENNDDDLTSYIKYSLEQVKNYLNLNTEILVSSQIKKDNSLHAQDRIIEINKQLGSTHYINTIGGQDLYNKNDFEKACIKLNFIKMLPVKYKQFKNEFVPNLSIIDVLMFNSKEESKLLLEKNILI